MSRGGACRFQFNSTISINTHVLFIMCLCLQVLFTFYIHHSCTHVHMCTLHTYTLHTYHPGWYIHVHVHVAPLVCSVCGTHTASSKILCPPHLMRHHSHHHLLKHFIHVRSFHFHLFQFPSMQHPHFRAITCHHCCIVPW